MRVPRRKSLMQTNLGVLERHRHARNREIVVQFDERRKLRSVKTQRVREGVKQQYELGAVSVFMPVTTGNPNICRACR